MRPGLERIEALLDALGNPERRYTLVQVGGTNGKGSICGHAGGDAPGGGPARRPLHLARTSSTSRERIRVDGAADLRGRRSWTASTPRHAGRAARRHHVRGDDRARARSLRARGRGGRGARGGAGRPRSTPPRSGAPAVDRARRRIDFDHQAYLGDTLAAIAAEKAAIIRSGRGVLVARRRPEAAAVVERRARARWACRSCSRGATSRVTVRDRHARRPADRPAPGPAGASTTSRCRLLGASPAGQRAAGRGGGPRARRRTRRRSGAGSRRCDWPGRLRDRARGEPIVVLDGAHNPGRRPRAGAPRSPRTFPAQPVTLVIGVSADKDAARHPRARSRRSRAPRHPHRRPRARAPPSPGELARHLPPRRCVGSRSRPRPREALAMALAAARAPPSFVWRARSSSSATLLAQPR